MYELWDAKSSNVIRFFRTAQEAERVLTQAVRQQGAAILDPLFLLHEDDHEESHLVAEGQAILVAVKRLSAEEAASSPARRAV
jgi:hypothetical protein